MTPPKADPFQSVVALVQAGVEAWELAGKKISDLRQKHKDCYEQIIAKAPWLTLSQLHTLERIGRKEVYPLVMLETGIAVKWLMGYGYEEQKRVCTEGVDVLLYYKNDQPFTQRKPLRELSRQDTKQVFGQDHVRKPEDQRPFLSEHVRGRTRHRASHCGPRGFSDLKSENADKENADHFVNTNEMVPPPGANNITLGCYRLTIRKNGVAIEKYPAPPEAQVVYVDPSPDGHAHVAYIKVREHAPELDPPTVQERAWRELRESMDTGRVTLQDL